MIWPTSTLPIQRKIYHIGVAIFCRLKHKIESYFQRSFDKDRLSSGEKQFVMALYWALIQQSEQNLPYIIDTPLPVLIPNTDPILLSIFQRSTWSVIYSTNEEINRAHLASMDEQIAHMFTLQYGVDQRTYIHENHFEVS